MGRIEVLSRKYRLMECLFDDEDLSLINSFGNGNGKWGICKQGRSFYIQKIDYKSKEDYRVVKMHRLILGFPNGLIDHINGNSLDNRKVNLRVCNKAMNARNQIGPSSNNTSGYLGVTWDRESGKWKAQITVNRKHKSLGRFADIKEAIRVRQLAEKKYFYV